jgi:hypothetical protein
MNTRPVTGVALRLRGFRLRAFMPVHGKRELQSLQPEPGHFCCGAAACGFGHLEDQEARRKKNTVRAVKKTLVELLMELAS